MELSFIGTGRITESHLTSLMRFKEAFGIRVKGFWGPIPGRLAELTSRWGGKAYRGIEELLDDRPDAVYITSPTPFHPAQAIQTAERGIPMYLEKPLALDEASFEEMRQVIKQSGVLHCVGLQWRYRRFTRIIREALPPGGPSMAVAQWYWWTPPVPWLRDRKQGGGQVFDQMVHLIDLARCLVGDIVRVYAEFGQSSNSTYPDFDNWDVYCLTLRFASGCVGSFSSTYKLNNPLETRVVMDLISENQMIRYTPEKLEVHGSDQAQVYLEPAETSLDMVGRDAIEEAFLKAVRDDSPEPILTDMDAVRNTMEVLFAATQSAETGKPIEIG